MAQSKIRNRKVAILTWEGFEKLQVAISQTDIWNHYTKSCTLDTLSELTGLSTHTLSKIHTRKTGVDLRSLLRYFRTFSLKLETNDYTSPIRVDKTVAQFKLLPHQATLLNPVVSWGMAPDVSEFYGRTTELATLNHWILEQRCRLVTVIGMGGMGKTWLTTKLTEQIQHKFQCVIWRSLQSLKDSCFFLNFIKDLIAYLAPKPEPILPETTHGKIQLLLDCLGKARCLLVLDDVDSILQGHSSQVATDNSDAETHQHNYEQYQELLRNIAQGRHQSTVILTSRKEPKVLRQLTGENLPIRVLPIQGLQLEEVQQIFRGRGIYQANPTEWNRLITYYGGNPLFLGMVATTIKDLFDGNITAFFTENVLIFDDIREFLDQQFDSLSALEQDVIKVIATRNYFLSFADLRSHISPTISTTRLLEVLKSLKGRSLIENGTVYASLKPLLRDYLKE